MRPVGSRTDGLPTLEKGGQCARRSHHTPVDSLFAWNRDQGDADTVETQGACRCRKRFGNACRQLEQKHVSARNRRGECLYCGRHAKLTRDHIPPRALFGTRPTAQLLTVLCCSNCNRTAAPDDEYFRLNLALRDDLGEERDVVDIIPSVMRSLHRPEAPGLRAGFLAGVRNIEVTTPAGIILGTRMAYDVDLNRLARVPTRIVRALFSRQRGCRLPDGYDVHTLAAAGFRTADREFAEQVHEFLAPLINTQPISVGRVFSYWVTFEPNDPNVSVWLTLFFRRVVFISFTLPHGALAG